MGIKQRIKINNYQKIAIVYLFLILIGSILLSLPAATKTHSATPYIDALFTATSATCVTGLVVYDTFLYWSVFGQIVILFLIQIGGIGFMTIMTLFIIFIKRQLSLHDKCLFIQSAGAYEIGSTKKIIRQMVIGTFIVEFIGAVLLSIAFIKDMGVGQGIYYGIFHSISAFCNAGFDLMGRFGAFSSLTPYATNPLVNLTVITLIIIGGMGFLVWNDLIRNRFRWSGYSLHTKVALFATVILIVGGTAFLLAAEYNTAFAGLNFGEKLQAALFHSVTPRTAGFNTIDINTMSDSGRAFTSILMFIGGNPGSTAGGIKTTTAAVIVLSALGSIKRNNGITVFKRRFEDNAIREALAIVLLYVFAILLASFAVAAIQGGSLDSVFFEIISAIGTVGLSTGITPALKVGSKLIIILLMFGGKVGMLTLALSFVNKKFNLPLNRPTEKILIG